MNTTLYIGTKEIKNIVGTTVTYADDTTKEFTEKQLLCMVSEGPRDASQLQNAVINSIAPEMLMILQEYNIRKGDFQNILETIVSSFNNSFNVGIAKAFGTYDEKVHIMNCIEDITMLDILNATK